MRGTPCRTTISSLSNRCAATVRLRSTARSTSRSRAARVDAPRQRLAVRADTAPPAAGTCRAARARPGWCLTRRRAGRCADGRKHDADAAARSQSRARTRLRDAAGRASSKTAPSTTRVSASPNTGLEQREPGFTLDRAVRVDSQGPRRPRTPHSRENPAVSDRLCILSRHLLRQHRHIWKSSGHGDVEPPRSGAMRKASASLTSLAAASPAGHRPARPPGRARRRPDGSEQPSPTPPAHRSTPVTHQPTTPARTTIRTMACDRVRSDGRRCRDTRSARPASPVAP